MKIIQFVVLFVCIFCMIEVYGNPPTVTKTKVGKETCVFKVVGNGVSELFDGMACEAKVTSWEGGFVFGNPNVQYGRVVYSPSPGRVIILFPMESNAVGCKEVTYVNSVNTGCRLLDTGCDEFNRQAQERVQSVH